MPIPSYAGLQTALSGLEAAQAAIDTTGQNIANANTPGYSRQRVVETERDPLSITTLSSVTGQGSQVGLGVDITTIRRIRDQFLDNSYRTQNTQTSGEDTQSTLLGQVQAALDEPTSSGLSGRLTTFWQAWNGLVSAANSSGALQGVIGAGEAVAEGLGTLAGQLTALESQVTQQYDALSDPSTGAIASDANQIAALNVQIAQAQTAGLNANNLLDRRDQLIDDLSQYSNVKVTTQSNGMVTVSFGEAATAVANGNADAAPLVDGVSVNLSQNLTDANLAGAGGTLGALLRLYDASSGMGKIADYLTALDGVASQLVSSVNGAIGSAAAPFFDPSSTTAASVAVNPSLTSATASRASPSTRR